MEDQPVCVPRCPWQLCVQRNSDRPGDGRLSNWQTHDAESGIADELGGSPNKLRDLRVGRVEDIPKADVELWITVGTIPSFAPDDRSRLRLDRKSTRLNSSH